MVLLSPDGEDLLSQLVMKLSQFFVVTLSGLSRSQRSLSMQPKSKSIPGNALVRFSQRAGVKPVQPEAGFQKIKKVGGPTGPNPSFLPSFLQFLPSFGGPIGS
jgi:hypothetical protein